MKKIAPILLCIIGVFFLFIIYISPPSKTIRPFEDINTTSRTPQREQSTPLKNNKNTRGTLPFSSESEDVAATRETFTARNVTPAGILPAPPITGPLKRAEVIPAKPVEKKHPKSISAKRPTVTDATTLKVNPHTLRLAYINAPGAKETCPSRLGGDWPCGARARTALRAFVLRNTIECDILKPLETRAYLVRCRRGAQDLSQWMIKNGWATPTTDAPKELQDLGEAARLAKKGLWQLDGPTRIEESSAPSIAKIPMDNVVIIEPPLH